MKITLMLMLVMGVASVTAAQPVEWQSIREVRFIGDDPVATELIDALGSNDSDLVAPEEAMCARVLDLERIAESHNRR